MRRRSRGSLVAVAAVAVVAVSSACSASHPGHPAASTPVVSGSADAGLAARATALDAAVTAHTASIAGHAFTAAVVTDAGDWSAATGADGTGTRLTAQSELAVGSITKTFTTAEILHLAAARELDLDAPTSRYVRSPLTANGATVRETLSMTSGIRDGAMVHNFTTAESATPDQATTPADELVYATTPSVAIGAPGQYSNAGFLLLGQVIERVTGVSYAAAVRRDLLTPAGLDRVTVQTSEKPTAPVAYPELNAEKPVTDGWLPDRAVSAGAGSAGSVAADAPDIARWGYDLYAAHRVASAADVAAMTSPTSLGGSYGLGTVLYPAGGDAGLDEPAVGHDGEIARFTAGAQYGVYTSYLLVVPSEHVSVAILGPKLVTLTALSHLAGALVRAAGGH